MYTMASLFSRLEELSVRLNETSDSINESIKGLEAKLASLRIGVDAWLDEPIAKDPTFNSEGEEEGHFYSYFGYGRVNGTWRLLVTKYHDEFGHMDPTVIPLLQASRETRLKALQQVPSLIKVLEKKAEDTLKEVEKAKKVAESI